MSHRRHMLRYMTSDNHTEADAEATEAEPLDHPEAVDHPEATEAEAVPATYRRRRDRPWGFGPNDRPRTPPAA